MTLIISGIPWERLVGNDNIGESAKFEGNLCPKQVSIYGNKKAYAFGIPLFIIKSKSFGDKRI